MQLKDKPKKSDIMKLFTNNNFRKLLKKLFKNSKIYAILFIV